MKKREVTTRTEERAHEERGAIMTMRQVADRLQINERTVYELIRSGELKAHKLSTKKKARVRIYQMDFDAFVASRPKA